MTSLPEYLKQVRERVEKAFCVTYNQTNQNNRDDAIKDFSFHARADIPTLLALLEKAIWQRDELFIHIKDVEESLDTERWKLEDNAELAEVLESGKVLK